MGLQLTDHAVERFIARWRPGMPKDEASAELEIIAQGAAPTRKRTLVGDAQLYVALSEAGERIAFAVREGVALTVLPGDGEGNEGRDLSAKPEHIEESEATRAACRAILAAEAPLRAKEAAAHAKQLRLKNEEKSHRLNAISLIRDFRAGTRKVNADAMTRSYTLLGIGPNDPLPAETEPNPLGLPDRRRSAIEIVSQWRRGKRFSAKAIRNAHKVLGLPYP